jgi:glutathione S-transferase
MYVLHIGNKNYSSWSLRPWVLMKELGISFDERLHAFLPGSSWESFRTFSPTGRVPCLVDGSAVIWDSMAITEYLAERHAGVWPRDDRARAWARCAAAEMHAGFSALRERCPMNVGIRVRLHDMPAPLNGDIGRVTELWNEGLASFGGPFLAGAAFTAADAFFAPVAFRVQTYGLKLSGAAARYPERLLALAAVREWEAAALTEAWREADHEAEAARAGAIIEDLRKGVGDH